jgi:adenosine deaminase
MNDVSTLELEPAMPTASRALGFAIVALLVVSVGPVRPAAAQSGDAESTTATYFAAIRLSPPLLTAFLRRFPKGGDIHNHLAGALYAENMIQAGADAGLCLVKDTMTAVRPPCDAGAGRPPLSAALTDQSLYDAIIDAWSMRFFVPLANDRSGHDHFFATFDRFSLAATAYGGAGLGEVMGRAAAQNELYLELMDTPAGDLAARAGGAVGWDGDAAATRQRLLAGGLEMAVTVARRQLDLTEAGARERLRCGAVDADPGCDVTVRYLYQVIRILPPEAVFAQMVLGFELARVDPRVVGLNLVAPEDDLVARRDYLLHMRMLQALHAIQPTMNIALHAGELTLGLVPPEDLSFHIRAAIEIGQARRIGHGVSIMNERDPLGLLEEMRRRDVLVEINLTSNELILGVEGIWQPTPIYLAAGVPITLSTDDEGVSRIDLTNEYRRATEAYDLSYQQLKTMSRNSLSYSFLAGASLWRSPNSRDMVEPCARDTPAAATLSEGCRAFLTASDKATLQWRLEERFAAFEAEVASRPLPPVPASPRRAGVGSAP